MNAETKRPDINGIRAANIAKQANHHPGSLPGKEAKLTLDLLAYIDRLESSRGTEIAGLRAELGEVRTSLRDEDEAHRCTLAELDEAVADRDAAREAEASAVTTMDRAIDDYGKRETENDALREALAGLCDAIESSQDWGGTYTGERLAAAYALLSQETPPTETPDDDPYNCDPHNCDPHNCDPHYWRAGKCDLCGATEGTT